MLQRVSFWLSPIVLGAALLATPAAADDAEQLTTEVERLNGDLADMRVQLAQSSGSMTPAQAAAFETRLAAFEQELRSLTGMVEQVTYQQNQFSQRLDRMQADVEYRLSTLEGGTPGTTTGSVTPAAPTTQAVGGAINAGGATVDSATQGDVKTLGTIAQGELAQAQQQAGNAQPQPISPQPATVGASDSEVAALPGGSPKEQYDYAFGLLRKADYAGAEAALLQFVSQHPSDPLAANAKYWLGETYYVRGNYDEAARAFAVAYQDHPDGAKATDSLLKLGLSLSLLGRGAEACDVFDALETRFPDAAANILQRSKQERSRLGC